MATRNTLSTRWVTVVMVAAMVCSVVVVWGLIQITGQSPASSSTPSAGASAAFSESAAPSASEVVSTPTGDAAESTGGTATAGPGASASGSGSADRPGVITVPLTTAPVLPGTGLRLPAAWTGNAEMTITVLGRCAATGGTSSYTRTAELALQGPVVGSGPVNDPNPLSMTLGITPAEIPGLSIYSATTDRSGDAQRTWWLTTGTDLGPAGDSRTLLSGVLIDDQPVPGVLPPNLLVDSETDLQPCESGGTVRVPRTLAAGSTVTGWVTPSQGHLDLTATTADGERKVTAAVELTRKPTP